MCIGYNDSTVEPGSVKRYLTPRRGLDNVGFIGKDFLEDVRCQRRQQMYKVCQKVEMWPMNTIWKGRQRYALEGVWIPRIGGGASTEFWVQVRKHGSCCLVESGSFLEEVIWIMDETTSLQGNPSGPWLCPVDGGQVSGEKTEDHRRKIAFFLGPQSTAELTLRCPNAHSKLYELQSAPNWLLLLWLLSVLVLIMLCPSIISASLVNYN